MLLCACCPGGATVPSQKTPHAEGGGNEHAMAGPCMEALTAKCVWRGAYVNWKEKGAR